VYCYSQYLSSLPYSVSHFVFTLRNTDFIVNFSTSDDNEEPDSQYEAILAALTDDYDYDVSQHPKNKHRGRLARSTKRRNKNNEDSEEENDSNAAEPQSSKAANSYIRRQEFLAKAAAAAGSEYKC
jgi:hypothetical protein